MLLLVFLLANIIVFSFLSWKYPFNDIFIYVMIGIHIISIILAIIYVIFWG